MKIEWATVPAGEFQMGDNFGDGDANERPVHLVYLDRYEISKFEITYEQYDLFCKESKRAMHGQSAGNGAGYETGSSRQLGRCI